MNSDKGYFYESRGSSLYCVTDCDHTAHSPVIIINAASFDCQSDSSSRASKNTGKQKKKKRSSTEAERLRSSRKQQNDAE